MADGPIRLNPVRLVVCFDSGDWEEHEEPLWSTFSVRKKQPETTSTYYGVCYQKGSGSWRARVFAPTAAGQQTEYQLGLFAREESAGWKVFTFLDDKYTTEQFTKLFTGENCCTIPHRAYDLPGDTDLPPCPRDWPLDQPLDEAGYESENESEAAGFVKKKDPFGGVDVNQQADILTSFLPNAFVALSVLYPRLGDAAAEEDGRPRALLFSTRQHFGGHS
jgi:hypothetical protein